MMESTSTRFNSIFMRVYMSIVTCQKPGSVQDTTWRRFQHLIFVFSSFSKKDGIEVRMIQVQFTCARAHYLSSC